MASAKTNPLSAFATGIAQNFNVPAMPNLADGMAGSVLTRSEAAAHDAASESWRQSLQRQIAQQLSGIKVATSTAAPTSAVTQLEASLTAAIAKVRTSVVGVSASLASITTPAPTSAPTPSPVTPVTQILPNPPVIYASDIADLYPLYVADVYDLYDLYMAEPYVPADPNSLGLTPANPLLPCMAYAEDGSAIFGWSVILQKWVAISTTGVLTGSWPNPNGFVVPLNPSAGAIYIQDASAPVSVWSWSVANQNWFGLITT